MAVALMLDHAEDALRKDAYILNQANQFIEDFGSSATFTLGQPTAPRPSAWDASPFEVRLPNVSSSPQSLIHDQPLNTNFEVSEAAKPHPLFRKVGPNRKARTKAESVVTDEDRQSRRVFLVHGREKGPRKDVELLLMRLGLEPVVLEDQPNQGRTLIEKFENHANVAFAVVLLTPEDECRSDEGTMAMRPRQNVVLELGYLMAKLGRSRVAAILVDDLEGPSDVRGFAYIPFDADWKLRLARELQAAGLSVDLNKLG